MDGDRADKGVTTDPHRSFVAGAALLAAVLLESHATASDQAITGKKLLLKSTPRMVLLSRDPLVAPGANGGASDPRCVAGGGSGSGAAIKLDDGTNSVSLSMPCESWSTNGSGTLYRYKDTAGAPKIAKVGGGFLKVVSPGTGGFPVASGPATVNLEVTVGSDKYCMTFSGTGDGSRFLVKDAAAASCASPPACPGSGVAVVGVCWHLGAAGASCTSTCASVGGSYNELTRTYAGSDGTDANCTSVVQALGVGYPFTPNSVCSVPATYGACGCVVGDFNGEHWRCDDLPTTADGSASPGAVRRVCACD